eukprot:451559-Pelagomonas_calceolata.AAC.2
MHEMLDFLLRHSKAPTLAPAPYSNSMSDSSDSSPSDSGCSSADEQESARKKQAAEPTTVASRAAEFRALLGVSKGGSVVERTFSAFLKCLKSHQRSSLKEKHTVMCARRFKSMEYDLVSLPCPDAISRWLDAKKKRGRYGLEGDVGKVQFAVGEWMLDFLNLNTWRCMVVETALLDGLVRIQSV